MATVMLVEDDPLIVRLYKKTLELEGFKVETADNGLSALEQIPLSRPDVILLDIMMPTMNGIEFLKRVEHEAGAGQTPVIVLTNLADEDVKTEAATAGARLVLVKSQTEPDDVVNAVKQVLGGEILQVGEDLDAAETTAPEPTSDDQN
jgi:CheY-like chemotaxis protein